MKIPISEILDNDNHYHFKSNCELSLEHQLRKVLHYLEAVGKRLDEEQNSPYMYVRDPVFIYDIDALVHGSCVLMEYYYGWILYSHIGTTKHKKAIYKPRERDDEVDEFISNIFDTHTIGTLKDKSKDSESYYQICKAAFLKAYDLLFIGKYHELYTLNNYQKHNAKLDNYKLPFVHRGTLYSTPYLFLHRPLHRLLNPSVLRCLFEHPLDATGKISSSLDDYYVRLVNTSSRKLPAQPPVQAYCINGVEYVINTDQVGITVESVVAIVQELFNNVSTAFIESSPGEVTRIECLSALAEKALARPAKTLGRLFPG
ncbi:hypothetical protein [Pseudomonas sp. microsymbiont 2]